MRTWLLLVFVLFLRGDRYRGSDLPIEEVKRTPGCSVLSPLHQQIPISIFRTHLTAFDAKKRRNARAVAANFANPSLSPIDNKSNISALKSPAFSKLSLAKSNLQTANARSPIAFHFASASCSGTPRTISTAASRSSSWRESSNFWSGSVVTSSASSLKP